MEFSYTGVNANEVNAVLQSVVAAFQSNIGENLKGLYLHGSLAMGCFRPWVSDIDLLAVVFEPMGRDSKLALVADIMEIADGGLVFRSIEFSVVTSTEARQAKHPINYILHYSRDWHQAYKEGRADLVLEGGEDEDLAAHFMVVRQRGIALTGAPIEDTFGQVSKEDYLKAVWYDVANAEDEVGKNPVYTVLNLCRTLLYLSTGKAASKLEGGQWALEQQQLSHWKLLIEEAIGEYTQGRKGEYKKNEVISFIQASLSDIRKEIEGID